MGFLDSVMQNIRNKNRSDIAAEQVKTEETRTEKSGQIPQLIEQATRRLLGQDGIPPWTISGGDKEVQFAGDNKTRPGYYIAAKYPNWFIFLTFNEQKEGVLVNKPDFYTNQVTSLQVENLSHEQQNAVALGLQKILDIKDADFKALPRDRQSWQNKVE
ncbi:MAG: hypothetical protein JWM07_817 [Candidatus Saccharibacteria bacterium]|nr:hypothetical protein [Candidatus Saccharibacteria bacterium]